MSRPGRDSNPCVQAPSVAPGPRPVSRLEELERRLSQVERPLIRMRPCVLAELLEELHVPLVADPPRRGYLMGDPFELDDWIVPELVVDETA